MFLIYLFCFMFGYCINYTQAISQIYSIYSNSKKRASPLKIVDQNSAMIYTTYNNKSCELLLPVVNTPHRLKVFIKSDKLSIPIIRIEHKYETSFIGLPVSPISLGLISLEVTVQDFPNNTFSNQFIYKTDHIIPWGDILKPSENSFQAYDE